MRRALYISYLVGLHAFLALVLWKSDFLSRAQKMFCGMPPDQEITEHYSRMLRYQARMDGNVPDGSVFFIGDSLTQGLCSDAVISPSVNYGIGSDTTVGVLRRLPEYHSLQRASAVVIAIGVNDLMFRHNREIVANYSRILQELSSGLPVVCSAVLPINEAVYDGPSAVNNQRICDLNASLKVLASNRPGCVFLDVGGSLVDQEGNLLAALHDGDGVHINSEGNRIWIDGLRVAIAKAKQDSAANGS